MSAVTWSKMRTFLAVADLGSVRAAAARLHVTEPAVSAAVAQVERHLGVDLLSRDGRGIRLSEAGTVYADYCRTVLGLLDEAEAAVRTAGTGRLRIGAVATVGEAVLPRLLAGFRERYPDVELSLSVRPRDELFAELAQHQTDLVVAGRPPRAAGLVSRAQRPNRLVVVAAPDHDVPPASATWLLRGQGSGTRETCLGLLAQREWQPPTLTLGTHGAVVAAAREGLGMTLVHSDAVATDIRAGLLREVAVPGTPLDRPWQVVTNPGPPAAARLFVEHVCSEEQAGAARFHPRNRLRG